MTSTRGRPEPRVEMEKKTKEVDKERQAEYVLAV